MARGFFHKVGGSQAREAERRGFVKIDRATAKRFWERGFPVIVTGSRVDPEHFLGGQRLALVMEKRGSRSLLAPRLPTPARTALALRGDARLRSSDFDTFMRGVDEQMKRSPFGPHAVTFVLRDDYPRLDR